MQGAGNLHSDVVDGQFLGGPVTVSAEWEGLGAACISPVLAQPSSSFHSFSRVINLRGQLGLSSDICKGQLKGL